MTDAQTQNPNEDAAPVADPMRDLMYRQLRPQVERGISDGIEDEKNKIRYGGGFFGAIIGFLFRLAEALGIDKWVAGLFGKHIPDENDKKILTDQVTSSVSRVLTAKDAAGKPMVAGMSDEQVEEAVRNRVAQDLQGNEHVAHVFTEEQIAKIAGETASSVKNNMDTIRAAVTPAKLNMTDVKLTGTPEQQVEQTLGAMADGILNNPMTPAEKRAAMALKPALVSIGAKVVMENKDKINDPDALATLYTNALQKDEATRNRLAGLGMDLNDPGSREMVTLVIKNNLDVCKDTLAKAVEGQATAIAAQAPAALPEKDLKSMVARKVAEGIEEQAAEGIVEKWRGGGFIGWYVNNKRVDQATRTYTKYENRELASLTPAEKRERESARHVLYQRAVEMGDAPNNAQRTKIGEIVAETAAHELKNPANKDLPQEALANRLQAVIESGLKREQNAIDACGTPIDKINDKTWPRANTDILKDIAAGIGDKIRNPDDKDKVYDLVKIAQTTLLQQNAVAKGGMPEIPENTVASSLKGGRHKDIPAGTAVDPLGGSGKGNEIYLG